jgi:hypothetical protein
VADVTRSLPFRSQSCCGEVWRHYVTESRGIKWLWLKLEWRRYHMTAIESRGWHFHCFLSRLSSIYTVEIFEDCKFIYSTSEKCTVYDANF